MTLLFPEIVPMRTGTTSSTFDIAARGHRQTYRTTCKYEIAMRGSAWPCTAHYSRSPTRTRLVWASNGDNRLSAPSVQARLSGSASAISLQSSIATTISLPCGRLSDCLGHEPRQQVGCSNNPLVPRQARARPGERRLLAETAEAFTEARRLLRVDNAGSRRWRPRDLTDREPYPDRRARVRSSIRARNMMRRQPTVMSPTAQSRSGTIGRLPAATAMGRPMAARGALGPGAMVSGRSRVLGADRGSR